MSAARALPLFLALLAACGTPGSTSVYAGVGYYNSWGWGPCCYPVGVAGPPVVVAPPPGGRPPPNAGPRPTPPIANAPPPPRPSAAPRPAAPRGGGGRRR
jgi:hypothetical protein